MTDSKEEIRQQLLKTTRARIVRATSIPESELAHLSLGDSINFLFLLIGEHASIGEFWPTFHAVHKIVGRELLWAETEAEKAAETVPFVQ